MKAIRVHQTGGAEVLRYEEVPPPAPAAGELLVQIEATGVNFIDVYHRTGLYPVERPFTPGQEAAGVVRAVGSDVTEFAVGDRVGYAGVVGSYAQYQAVAADRVIALPNGVTAKHAAAVLLQGMTAHYLTTSTYPLQRGDRCLVHAAAGGVGLLLCQMAKLRGAEVFGTVSTEEKAALARDAGADHVILYTKRDFATEVQRLTREAGVQVVYDSVGRTTFEKSLDALALRGTMVLFGQSSGPVPPLDAQVLSQKGSLFLTRPTLRHYTATRQELARRAGELFEWLRKRQLTLRISREYGLAEAAQAHRDLEGRRTTGKLLLIP